MGDKIIYYMFVAIVIYLIASNARNINTVIGGFSNAVVQNVATLQGRSVQGISTRTTAYDSFFPGLDFGGAFG